MTAPRPSLTHVESRPKRVLLSEKQFNEIEGEVGQWRRVAHIAMVGWAATVVIFVLALVPHA